MREENMDTSRHQKLLEELLRSGKYCDLTISCRDREFNVHRAIVCLRCPPFAAACGEFLEGTTGKITLDDDDQDTVWRMISYLYTHDYEDEEHFSAEEEASPPPSKENREKEGPALFSSVRVYAIADKYMIPTLKELAKERFSKWAERNWSHPDFPAIVKEVCQSTPRSDRGLRDIVSRIIGKHTTLLENDELYDPAELFGELGLEVLRQLMNASNSLKATLNSLKETSNSLREKGLALQERVKRLERERKAMEEENEQLKKALATPEWSRGRR